VTVGSQTPTHSLTPGTRSRSRCLPLTEDRLRVTGGVGRLNTECLSEAEMKNGKRLAKFLTFSLPNLVTVHYENLNFELDFISIQPLQRLLPPAWKDHWEASHSGPRDAKQALPSRSAART
jgi:hypothetical protein